MRSSHERTVHDPTPRASICSIATTSDLLARPITQQIEVGEFEDEQEPWELYLEASRRIGFDFTEHFGEPAEVRSTPIEGGAPGMRLHVLVLKGGRTIGAWLSSDDDATGGSAIYPLDDPP